MVTGHKDKKGDFHPHTNSSGGVSENDMKISVKGNNDTIRVVGKKEFDRDVKEGKGFNVKIDGKSTSGMKGNQTKMKRNREGIEYSNNFAENDLEFEVREPKKIAKIWSDMTVGSKEKLLKKMFPKWEDDKILGMITKPFDKLDPYSQYFISQEI